MEEASERPRYQITYQLIRADGLGDWAANFENITWTWMAKRICSKFK